MSEPKPALDIMLQQIAVQSPEHAFVLLDADGRTRWGNEAACRILGVGPEVFDGGVLDDYFVPEERALGVPQNEIDIARAGSAAEDDRWQQRADASRFWASGVLMPLYDDSGALLGFGKIFRNRTDIRQQLETLRNQLDAAHERETLRGHQLAQVAHELRNPLTSITFGCDVLRTRSTDAAAQAALDVLELQLGVLKTLVGDLVDVAVTHAGGMQLELAVIPINVVLREAVAALRGAASERGHTLDVLLVSDALCVHADRQRLHQVFVNLLQNAIKFTPPGGHIWVKATTEGDDCVARVEDNGIGLAPETIGSIFEMFSRAAPAHAAPGLGVGLAVVRAIVERHGGSVQVESDGLGAGSKFVVRLPMAAPVPAAGP